ncbi:hypothetical protein DSO57_1009382 [Entomophthora muscae]|uniref:Uncharacterized protein n=1 Tax=Entomophthora muscae TaxID=34485 RepID=A0ACC2SJY9_9FUNG|nr:hypothetical protein DSO57_1009382 [Entomophthora muscae]
MVLLSKLTPEHPKKGAYVLKESIVYQNEQIWVPKSLCARVMKEHHDPPVWVSRYKEAPPVREGG